jgi:hypothetical protein
MRRKYQLPLSSLLILMILPSIALANPTFIPLYYLTSGWWALAVIAATLAIEYPVVKKISGFGQFKAMAANIVMNSVSALLGIIVFPFLFISSGFITVHVVFPIYKPHSAYDWILIFSFFISFPFMVLADTAIEALVLKLGFKVRMGKHNLAWLTLVNLITVGISYVCIIFLNSLDYAPDQFIG